MRWRETHESSSTFKADASHMTGGKALWAVYSKTHQVCTSSHTQTLTGQSPQHHKPSLIRFVRSYWPGFIKRTNKQTKKRRTGFDHKTWHWCRWADELTMLERSWMLLGIRKRIDLVQSMSQYHLGLIYIYKHTIGHLHLLYVGVASPNFLSNTAAVRLSDSVRVITQRRVLRCCHFRRFGRKDWRFNWFN